MRMPWDGKSGLAKATSFFATITLVSLGLCGANFVAVMSLVSWGGAAGPRDVAGTALTFAGVAELVGIAVGIIGFFVVAVIATFRSFRSRSSEDKSG